MAAGQKLVRSFRGRVSGRCQPTHLLDDCGGRSKVPIAACAASRGGSSEGWVVEDWAGRRHSYPPDPVDGRRLTCQRRTTPS
jgi:lysine 2,3-aminomutase